MDGDLASVLVSRHRRPMPGPPDSFSIDPRLRVNYGRRFAFGPGKAELLEHIERTGSIGEAARAMDMSYMRAWTLVKSLDRGFAEPLVNKSRGGRTRGGATLTKTGRRVLGLYREMETASQAAIQAAGKKLNRLLKP
jgi:molybdate transport system regulatory protein